MPKYIFEKVADKDNDFDLTNVVMEVDTCSLNDLLYELRLFLIACGYCVPGELQIEDEIQE